MIKTVEQWLNDCVLGLSLCPYAKAPIADGKVRIVCCAKKQVKKSVSAEDQPLTEVDFLSSLEQEIEHLLETPEIETTLLAGPGLFEDFLDFNDFTGYLEKQLRDQEIDEHLQIATFHPGYLFAGEAQHDQSNYTNRAPYPIVQLLRTESVAAAVESGETLEIPQRNIERLRGLDPGKLGELFPWVKL